MPKMKQLFILVTYSIFLAIALLNMDKVLQQIDFFLMIIQPISYGFVTAFLLNFLVVGIERYWLGAMDGSPQLRQYRRSAAIFIALTFTCATFAAIIAIMVPELSASFTLLINKAPELSDGFQNNLNLLMESMQLNNTIWLDFQSTLSTYTDQLIRFISDGIPKVLLATTNFAGAILNFIIGLIVSVYLLMSKEQLQKQFQRTVTVLFNPERALRIIYISELTARCFNNFVYVRLLESLIIFVMMFVAMLLLGMPYVALISLIAAVTNLVPVVGPIIGAIPCFFLIAVLDVKQAVIFLILHTVVQQVEGNIIGPQISGNALGLPGLWVMISLVLGGGLFGMTGLLVAPPLTTVLYEITREYINNRYHSKKKPRD